MSELKRRKKPQLIIRYASVQFKGAYRQYTFKTLLTLAPGDKVVVRTKNGLSTGEVFGTHLPTPTNDMKYNWIVGKIDLKAYDKDFVLELKDYGINEDDK
jgi:hypothetical protein